jgi:hypothetical protein
MLTPPAERQTPNAERQTLIAPRILDENRSPIDPQHLIPIGTVGLTFLDQFGKPTSGQPRLDHPVAAVVVDIDASVSVTDHSSLREKFETLHGCLASST